jgi:orotate phosphoribosyltransferase
MTKTFDPASARARLLELVRERAYRDGLDITLVSGKKSSFYVNGKKITLHPEGLYLFAELLLDELEKMPEVTAIGGLTMGADPIAAAVCAQSWQRGRPIDAFLVRKEAKDHGTGSRIEGDLVAGQKVAIVEDTVTTGGSSRKAIDAVREAGADPVVIFALVDREDEDAAPFREEFDLRPVFTIRDLRGAE